MKKFVSIEKKKKKKKNKDSLLIGNRRHTFFQTLFRESSPIPEARYVFLSK